MKPGHEYGCVVHLFVLFWTAGIGQFVVKALSDSGHRNLAIVCAVLLVISIPGIYKLADRIELD